MTTELTRSWSPGGVVLCGACARLGDCRLGVTAETLAGESVSFELRCPADHEGGPRVAHGGWTAGVMDEIVGHVPVLMGQLAVTGTLTTKFVKPVPIETPLLGRARLDRIEGRRWFVTAEITLARGGALLASAEAILVARDLDHFARHEAWLAEQENR